MPHELCFEDEYLSILNVTFLYFDIFSTDSAFFQEKKNDRGVVERTSVVSIILGPNATNAQKRMTLSESFNLYGS